MAAEPERMRVDRFIGCDWGTSNLRLYLCEFAPSNPSKVLATRRGPGVKQTIGSFEAVFFDLTDDWFAEHEDMPVIISGMVGSAIGWKEAPYLTCPVTAGQIMDGRREFEARGVRFSMVAGLSTENPLGMSDVLRGEELQLLGWMRSADAEACGTLLFVLPGTHNKWVVLQDGKIQTFVTAMTGELFALLNEYSVLVPSGRSFDFTRDAFEEGLTAVEQSGGADFLHTVFATRSRQVLGELSDVKAPSYLSGLLIGSDVAGALAVFRDAHPEIERVILIGEPRLTELYEIAIERAGLSAEIADAERLTIAGYETVYAHLFAKDAAT